MGPKLPTSTGELSFPDFWTKKNEPRLKSHQVFSARWAMDCPPDFCGYFDVFFFAKQKQSQNIPNLFCRFFLCTWNSGCWWVLKVQTLKFQVCPKGQKFRTTEVSTTEPSPPNSPTRQLKLYIRLTIPEISGFKLQTVNSSHPTLAISRHIKKRHCSPLMCVNATFSYFFSLFILVRRWE